MLMAVSAQFANQIRDSRHGLAEGSSVGDLRADVNADAAHASGIARGGFRVKRPRIADGHAELVFMQTG